MMRNTMLVSLALVIGSGAAVAKAPLQKGQAPGWFRMKVGDFEVTALSDGTAELPMDQLLAHPPEKTRAALAAVHLKNPPETSVNAYLVNTGAKLVLIDAGAAGGFGPTLGKMIVNLKASGYTPEQVDEIYITHMHVDHLGGITVNDKAVFPNAVVRAAKAEGDFWLSADTVNKVPEQMKGFVKGAQAAMKPYLTAGKWKPFEGADVELIPGVRALAAAGHTPGHTIYAIESKGEKMQFWGDIMHVAAVQFADPSVTIQFDSDAKAAAPARKKVFADAAAKGFLVGVAHISFPGIGYVKAEGKGYAWIPVNYTRNPDAAPAPAAPK